MARAIVFDLAEVLLKGIPGSEPALAEVFSVPRETVLPGMRGEIMDEYCRGRMTEDEFWSRVCAKNSWQGDVVAARAALRRNFHSEIPGTVSVLREVAEEHDTYLLSDHGREWIEYIRGVHDFFKVFKRQFLSYDLGSRKSERVTFEKVLAELDIPPGEMLFIDDNAGNIEVARSAGIDAVHFTGAEELRKALSERGIF